MKRFLLLSCAAFLSMMSFADKTVYLNGVATQQNVVSISFDGDYVLLSYDDNSSFKIDMESVEIDFTGNAGVDDATSSFLSVNTLVGDVLRVSNVETGLFLQIFDVNGRVWMAKRAESDVTEFQTTVLPKGAYLLKAGNKVVKFIKN